ncbi:putative isoaspartyl peptidase/L-asparaginase 3 [Artemisia annua]|uniref:beta-aspartyl-peptidase n=1 Tax=Artemisia annua TaxID=35608 RepID=A0A2U1PRX3_ARTAN|nr:putative isoaspartyl peptidase/L-asparaginase 3 [Artemisia annua]
MWAEVRGHAEVESSSKFPLVISTWPFLDAVRSGWTAINAGLSSVDAVVEGCSTCEVLRCDGTVGPGGSPDENGESTMDALIMNGVTALNIDTLDCNDGGWSCWCHEIRKRWHKSCKAGNALHRAHNASGYQVVESMRLGMEPKLAAKDAIISRRAKKYPNFVGALFAVNKKGTHAGSCYGWTFQYSVRSTGIDDLEVVTVYP